MVGKTDRRPRTADDITSEEALSLARRAIERAIDAVYRENSPAWENRAALRLYLRLGKPVALINEWVDGKKKWTRND